MKKFLLLGSCLLSLQGLAYTSCVGGQEITANKYGVVDGVNQDKGGYCLADGSNCNGQTFCVSNQNINWWSAVLWCQSNGGTLADLETLCPGIRSTGDNPSADACPNFTSKGWLWTNVQRNKGSHIVLRNGQVSSGDNTITFYYQAICE